MGIDLPNNRLAEIPKSTGFQLIGDDSLLLTVDTPYDGVSLRLTGRHMRPDGTVTLLQEDIDILATPSGPDQRRFTIGQGILFNVALYVISYTNGACPVYARISVTAGQNLGVYAESILAAGYISSDKTLIYPPAYADPSTPNNTFTHVYEFSGLPGGGGSYTPPPGCLEVVRAVAMQYSASAVVANRYPYIEFVPSSGIQLRSYASQPVTAGTTPFLSWFPGAGIVVINTRQTISLPDNLMIGESIGSIQWSTESAQAGDGMAVTLYVDRYVCNAI